jgi:hypothetical protein
MPGQNQTLQKPQSMQQQENANEENIQLPWRREPSGRQS